jgi:NhaP-type Na+/H+ or K+/H+ antiporter
VIEHTVLVLTGIVLVGITCQWVAWRFKVPAILLLLSAGLIAGPGTGLLKPDEIFGELLFPIVSLGVAIVLFEGSLTLRLHEVREVAGVVRNLVTIGALITWVLAAAAAHWLLGFGWDLAFLFGALVIVTGPTVVVPMLRSIRPTAKITHVLRWEGIIIDPIGALLAVLVFEFIISGREGDVLMAFPLTIIAGVAVGVAAAALLGFVLRRHLVPHFLVNVVSLALVLSAFALANAIRPEAGLIAVTVMGIILANLDISMAEVLDFKESLSVLFISGLFIILAARIEVGQLAQLGWPALVLLAVLIFLARPLAVAISARGSTLDWRERALIAWIAPRGIVAAAVSAIFALRLEATNGGAGLLVPLTFLVIMGTVVVQSLTARPLARMLGVAEPEPNGVLIVGANAFARALGAVLVDKGFRVILAGTDWSGIRAARMDGLSTYFGNPVSEHAERHLDLMGVGRLFALTDRPAFNALACVNYRNEFGADRVYAIKTPEEKQDTAGKATIARQYACARLFDEEATLSRLLGLLSEGAEIRTTHLTESFDMEAYRQKYRGMAIPLFAINETACLRVFTADNELKPGPGWSVVSLVPSEAMAQTEEGTTEKKARVRKAEHSGEGGAD